MANHAIGIDLGGTNIKGILVDESGTILAHAHTPTNDGSGGAWKTAIAETVKELKSKTNNLVGVGLSAPGLPNEKNECIASLPNRLEGLEFFHWGNYLNEKVYVLNDAHAALMAEAQFGVAKGLKNVILLTLGTGIGGGILINGQLYQGLFQKAGHLGHITVDATDWSQSILGMPGSIEESMGNYSVKKRSHGAFESTYDVLQAHLKGDYWASYVWLTSLQKLAVTISGLINALSPDAVVLSGGVTQANEHLFDPLSTFLNYYEFRPKGYAGTPILKAQYGDMAGALGVASFALSKQLK
jgi:glucokinase